MKSTAKSAKTEKFTKCRLCLRRSENFISIFKDDFPKMIELLTDIKVSPTDNFPNISCLQCASDVKQALITRKRIIYSHHKLEKDILEKQETPQHSTALTHPKTNIGSKVLATFPADSEIAKALTNVKSPLILPINKIFSNSDSKEVIIVPSVKEEVKLESLKHEATEKQEKQIKDKDNDTNKTPEKEFEKILIKTDPDRTEIIYEFSDSAPESPATAADIFGDDDAYTSPNIENLINLTQVNLPIASLDDDSSQETNNAENIETETKKDSDDYIIKFRRKGLQTPKDVQAYKAKFYKKCQVCHKVLHRNSISTHMRGQHSSYYKKSIEERRKQVDSDNPAKYKQCRICDKVMHSHSIALHMKTKHGVKRPGPSAEYVFTHYTECKICGKTLHKNSLSYHRRNQHGYSKKDRVPVENKQKPEFPKEQCDNEIDSTDPLIPPWKPIPCKLCKKLISKRDMREHMQTHRSDDKDDTVEVLSPRDPLKTPSRNSVVTCEVCGKILKKVNLKVHMEMHDIKMVKCEHCGKIVKNSYLRHHIMYNHSKKLRYYVCEHCGEKFKYNTLYHKHMKRVHGDGQSNHKCEECGKSFQFITLLKYHQNRVHRGLKPYKCEFCNKAFFAKNHLKTHLRQHTRETPYHCHVCKESFKQTTSLKLHLKNYHGITEEKNFTCEICGQGFSQALGLQTHTIRKHLTIKCPVCPKSFGEQKFLDDHITEEHPSLPEQTTTHDADMELSENCQEIRLKNEELEISENDDSPENEYIEEEYLIEEEETQDQIEQNEEYENYDEEGMPDVVEIQDFEDDDDVVEIKGFEDEEMQEEYLEEEYLLG